MVLMLRGVPCLVSIAVGAAPPVSIPYLHPPARGATLRGLALPPAGAAWTGSTGSAAQHVSPSGADVLLPEARAAGAQTQADSSLAELNVERPNEGLSSVAGAAKVATGPPDVLKAGRPPPLAGSDASAAKGWSRTARLDIKTCFGALLLKAFIAVVAGACWWRITRRNRTEAATRRIENAAMQMISLDRGEVSDPLAVAAFAGELHWEKDTGVSCQPCAGRAQLQEPTFSFCGVSTALYHRAKTPHLGHGSDRSIQPQPLAAVTQAAAVAAAVVASTAQPSPPQKLAELPPPNKSWALVTGATSGLGSELAEACVRAGYGVVLTELREDDILEELASKLRNMVPRARVVTMPADLRNPSEGASLLHRTMKSESYDVSLLLIASDQASYTGALMNQDADNLDRMLALNVGATSTLCRLFGSDMLSAGRGRILLVGAPQIAKPGLAGASAFIGSMAFVRSFADGLRQELAPYGVGVSCLETMGMGRRESLSEALASTCVSFLVPSVDKDKASTAASALRPEAVGAPVTDAFPRKSSKTLKLDGPGTKMERRNVLFADADASWTMEMWEDAYQQLAKEEDFVILPGGAAIDRIQRSGPAELSNALLVGFVCTMYVINRTTGVSISTQEVLGSLSNMANVLFTLDYLARWWSRGCSWSYLFTPAMIFDLVSVTPFLLRSYVPLFSGVELNFLKLLRVVRVYRFFRPRAFQDAARFFLPSGTEVDDFFSSVRPYQLQVVRTFGVLFTLVFITAGLVYEAEHATNEMFKDFFSAMYFSVIALSTVGFGDFSPVTTAGRAVVSISIIVGLCIIPFQASLVAAAVAEEQRRNELIDQTNPQSGERNAEAMLDYFERSRQQLAWDGARIAELEEMEREKKIQQTRMAELEAYVQGQSDGREGPPAGSAAS